MILAHKISYLNIHLFFILGLMYIHAKFSDHYD